MRIRITAKFASYFLASFFRTFVSCSLSHLLTNTREQSVLRWKSELDRVPSLYEKKTSRQTFGYFTRKPEIYYVLRRPRLSICRASSALLPSPPLLSRNFDIRGRSSTRPSFSKLEGEIIGRSVIQADDE